ncbi:MAG: carboxylesterase family protein, partial [Pseudomonadota bacterium]
GAAHAFEIPFVFNIFDSFNLGNGVIFGKETEEDRQRLSLEMGRYWASFARDGVPSSEDSPDWPTYGGGAQLLRFDTDNDGGIEVIGGADSFEAIAKDMIKDDRLDQEERCFIVNEIGVRSWIYDEPAFADMTSIVGCE